MTISTETSSSPPLRSALRLVRYENEWRLLVGLDTPANFWTTSRLVGGHLFHFMSLRRLEGKPADLRQEPEPIKLVRRAVIGCKAMPEFEDDALKVLNAPAYRHVHIQKAKLKEREFGLEYVDIRKPA